MSPILSVPQEFPFQPRQQELEAEDVSDIEDGEYEEIASEEVDRVVAALELLGESVASETIKSLLEGCSNEIYYMVYEDDDELGEAA